MKKLLAIVALGTCLSACGLGETAVSAAASGAAAAQEAKQAQATEARVVRDLDAAARLDNDRRHDAEAAAQ